MEGPEGGAQCSKPIGGTGPLRLEDVVNEANVVAGLAVRPAAGADALCGPPKVDLLPVSSCSQKSRSHCILRRRLGQHVYCRRARPRQGAPCAVAHGWVEEPHRGPANSELKREELNGAGAPPVTSEWFAHGGQARCLLEDAGPPL